MLIAQISGPGQEKGGKEFQLTLSKGSAEALALLEEVELWEVAPTMSKRCRKGPADSLGEVPKNTKPQAKQRTKRRKLAIPVNSEKSGAKDSKDPGPDQEAHEIVHSDIRRNENGRAAISKLVSELYDLDCRKFLQQPCFDAHHKCRLKHDYAPMLTWQQMLDAAPRTFETMWPGSSSFHDYIAAIAPFYRHHLFSPSLVNACWYMLVCSFFGFRLRHTIL